MPSTKHGRVFLIGAGPGHPGYLTLRGAQCLGRSDVVLYDYLVNPAVLRHASPQARVVCLGHHGHTRIWSQDEINAEMVRCAAAGLIVSRLKSGDPSIFARAAEELEALSAAGIEFEVVPGVTAAIAAGSCAGVPLTHRDFASAVALVTGQEESGKETSSLDYAALANFPGTLVFYMGVTTVDRWTAELIAAGKPAQTPCRLVRRCSFPDQQTISCRLDEVAARMTEPEKMRPPVIVVVGDVAGLPERYAWFERRPLFGQTVLVTRPHHQCAGLAEPLRELGAEVLVQPAITISPPENWSPVDNAIKKLAQLDWVVFSSSNGVRMFLERLLSTGHDMRQLSRTRIAVIGPGTADELRRYHLQPDVQPADSFRAETLAQDLKGVDIESKHVLLVRASRGREVLAEQLVGAGAKVEQVVAYRSQDVERPEDHVAALLADGKIEWMTVTSSAIARSLAQMFGDDLRKAKLASISPITSDCLRELGFSVAAEAQQYTMAGVVQAILQPARA